jgi:glycosyltransferase involved in cell wall biosynthesis
MRVLFLSSLWPPAVLGGAELYASNLARHLEDTGHSVGVVTLGVGGPEVIESAPVWPYRLDEYESQDTWRRWAFHARDQYDPSSGTAVRRAILEFGPDVVHSHAVAGMSVAALAAPSLLGVPHVHTLHDYWLLCQRTSLQLGDGTPCETRCARCRIVSAGRLYIARRHFAQVIIAVSEAIADEHRRAGFLPERIRVVRNPGEAPASLAPRPPVRTPLRLGYLGALRRHKGVRTLADAMQMLGDDVRLFVAGRGELERVLRRVPSATMFGWVDDAARERFFADVDCLVVPSEWKEPAPLVITEAAARGIPVIAADIGGIPEIVPEHSRPLLFPPGDAAALVDRVRRFARDPGAYSTPPSHTYGWTEHIQDVLNTYTEARSMVDGVAVDL